MFAIFRPKRKLNSRLALHGSAALVTLFASLPSVAQVQTNQAFNPQGPAPGNSVQGFTNSGAIEALLLDPALGADTMFVGATNGGIWRTTNGGQSWTPLTDHQASLSIASLGLDPTDPSGQTLIAGIGVTSNGAWTGFGNDGRGGLLTGLLYSVDGGNSWTPMGWTDLKEMSVIDVAARGATILAATAKPQDPVSVGINSQVYGLYLSSDGGQSFNLVSGASKSGLPSGPVTSLVGDPANPNAFYAAVASALDKDQKYGPSSVYKSVDAGATWTLVFDYKESAGLATFLRVAAGPNGSVAVGVVTLEPSSANSPPSSDKAQASAVFWSNAPSAGADHWTMLNPPNGKTWNDALSGLGQAKTNFAIAIDPNNAGLVYVSGDLEDDGKGQDANEEKGAPVYRIEVRSQTATSITGPGTSNQTFPHSDSRAIAFNSAGQMIMSGDGGVYLQTDPSASKPVGQWQSLNNGLQTGEPFAIAYGANAKLLYVARQDNGVALQSAPNSLIYNGTNTADGHNAAAANDLSFSSLNATAFYGSSQGLGDLSRVVVDSQGNIISHNENGDPGPVLISCSKQEDNLQPCDLAVGAQDGNKGEEDRKAPFVLNRVDPSRIAMAGTGVYVARDTAPKDEAPIVLHLTNVGEPTAASSTAKVEVSSLAYGTTDNPDVLIAGVDGATCNDPAVPVCNLFLSTTSKKDSLLPLVNYSGKTPSSLVFDQRSSSRFYAADGTSLWITSDQGKGFVASLLPQYFAGPASVEFINNNGVNALLVGGRPAQADVKSPILVANSDDNGKLLAWSPFGSGLPNTLVSTMSYNPLVDVLAVGSVGRGAWTLYDVTSYFPQATALQFGLANNDSRPDATYLTDGTSLGGTPFSRPLNKYGTGALTIAGNATYTGDTHIFGGTLVVNGSIASSPLTSVNAAALLTGTGTVGSLTINNGGTFAPSRGMPGGFMTIAGNLTFNPDSTYLVSLNASTSTSAKVQGAISLAGGTVAAWSTIQSSPAQLPTTRIPILTATGGVSGRFASLVGLPSFSFLSPSLFYGTNDVSIGYALTPFNVVGRTINQRNAGAALTLGAFTPFTPQGANILNSLFYGSYLSAQNVMDTVSGAGLSGVQATAMEIGQMASSAVSDQIAFWRSGESRDPMGVSSHESESDYGRGFMAYAPTELGVATRAPQATKGRRVDRVSSPPTSRTFRAWGSMFGGTANFSADVSRGAPSANMNFYGGLIGVDYQVTPNALIGVALGGSTAGFGVASLSTSGNLTGFNAGLYGAYSTGASYLALNETFSVYSNQTNRSAGGYLFMPYEKLSASFGSTEFRTRLEGGHTLQIGGLKATPFLAAELAAYQSNGFTEQSSLFWQSSLALRNNGQSINSVPTFVGLRLSNSYTLGNGWRFAPVGSVAYVHEFSPNRQLTNMLLSIPGPDFNVAGPRSTYNLLQAKIGAQLYLNNQFALFTDFQGEFSSASQSYGGKGGLKYYW